MRKSFSLFSISFRGFVIPAGMLCSCVNT
jgi:hypothetical protein